MKYLGKELPSLTDDELHDAIYKLAHMDGFRVERLTKVKKRHEKIFAKHPATENPKFTELVTALNSEFKKRNENA